MLSSGNAKFTVVKAALQSEIYTLANRFGSCLSISFLALMICLQCSYIDFRRADVSRNVLYTPEEKNFCTLILLRYLVGTSRAMKNLFKAVNAQFSCKLSCRSLISGNFQFCFFRLTAVLIFVLKSSIE